MVEIYRVKGSTFWLLELLFQNRNITNINLFEHINLLLKDKAKWHEKTTCNAAYRAAITAKNQLFYMVAPHSGVYMVKFNQWQGNQQLKFCNTFNFLQNLPFQVCLFKICFCLGSCQFGPAYEYPPWGKLQNNTYQISQILF